MEVRLDIWHYMRRFADCCATEAHPLYGIFLKSLSRCLFEWDADDVKALVEAKRGELALRGAHMPDEDVRRLLTKNDLARHCRRRTRGVQVTEDLLDQLVEAYESPRAQDVLGVPLFPEGALRNTWKKQRRHVACIQDPQGITLYYEEAHRIQKGGVSLPVYKCARGSTSLEGFHNHLARFIPGNC